MSENRPRHLLLSAVYPCLYSLSPFVFIWVYLLRRLSVSLHPPFGPVLTHNLFEKTNISCQRGQSSVQVQLSIFHFLLTTQNFPPPFGNPFIPAYPRMSRMPTPHPQNSSLLPRCFLFCVLSLLLIRMLALPLFSPTFRYH